MENSYDMFQIKVVLNFQNMLSKQKMGALQLIHISFSSFEDWKEGIRYRNKPFARLKFAEWWYALSGTCQV